MKTRNVFLIISITICLFLTALILLKGQPQDKVNFDAVAQIGESVLHHVDKIRHILTSVTTEEEMEIGDEIHNKTMAPLFEVSKDTLLIQYVNEVGNKVAENVKRGDIRYKFHIIDSCWPSASGAPGGHIYVTIGLLRTLTSEAELAWVLGHEITHVDAKHAIGAVRYGAIAGAADYQISLSPAYTEVQEEEADLGGVYLAYKAGYHPMAAVSALENISKAAFWEDIPNKSITPIGDTLDSLAGLMGRYFATHPLTYERLDKIKRYIADNKMLKKGQRFYIGQKNYIDKKSFVQQRYKEEFREDYPVFKEQKEEQ